MTGSIAYICSRRRRFGERRRTHVGQRVDQRPDRPARLDRVTHRLVQAKAVVRSAAIALALDETGGLEIMEDAHGSAFGDGHPVREISHADLRIGREGHEHMRVIRQERPRSTRIDAIHDMTILTGMWSVR